MVVVVNISMFKT